MATRCGTRTLLAMLSGLGALALGGCATTTSPSGRTQFVAPAEVGAVYSEVGLQTQLALSPEAYCTDKECESAAAFRLQFQRLGYRLGNAAHEIAPGLGLSPPGFIVSAPTKRDIGTLSSASGSLVVFDGLRQLELPEPALAFLIAREMGHIMAQHPGVATLLIAVTRLSVYAQVRRPFRPGTVWTMAFIRMNPGMEVAYLNYIATTWKANSEAAKKEGLILSYKVLTTEGHSPTDYNIILMTEYKDLATMEANEPKADALAQRIEGDDTKQMQGYKERAEIREIIGNRLAQEIVLEPRP